MTSKRIGMKIETRWTEYRVASIHQSHHDGDWVATLERTDTLPGAALHFTAGSRRSLNRKLDAMATNQEVPR